MEKRMIIALLFGMLLISPLIHAQIQSQTYSGFNRFVDNIRIFFTAGDNKVQFALEIREKEVNSAIANIGESNEEEVNKNLENAMNKLVIVQEKVSPEIADEVETSVNRIIGKIEKSNLTETLYRYVLEEKKTQLVAELVVGIEGKEGQTLTRKVVRNDTEGRNIVEVSVKGEGNETATWEIVGEMGEVQNNISEWVVKHTYAEGTSAGGESGVVIEGGSANGVQIYVAGDGTEENESLPEPDLNKVNPDLYNPDARAPGDTIDETYDDESPSYAEGTTAEGTNNPAP
jgi:hypothetical protein